MCYDSSSDEGEVLGKAVFLAYSVLNIENDGKDFIGCAAYLKV